MANTTFQGPVISKNGFFTTGPANVVDADSSTSLTVASHAGRIVHNNAAGAVTASPSVYLYQTPSSSFSGANYHLKFYYVAKIEDAGAYTLNADVIHGFIPPMCSGLAYYLSLKYSPDTAQANKLIYEDELQRALTADGSRTSTHITPQTFYGDGV